MNRVNEYIEAAERKNTRISYASGIRHFEIEWKGLLPTTGESITRYLADYATTLSISTLRQRLAALSRWHLDHGFADPTKSPRVRQVLKGIRAVHTTTEKRARPLELDVLQQVDQWLAVAIANAQLCDDQPALLRLTRDRSLILLGFWRGFRSDELVRLRVENVQIHPGEGMTCYLDRSKGDRQMQGRVYKCPSLSRLCPVTAFNQWVALAGLTTGPVFRKINRWGQIADTGLVATSLIPVLRSLFTSAGVSMPDEYSSHSLRRGFAGWARTSGWDIKDLMEYVGWRDIKSAMRYLDASDAALQARFEKGLAKLTPEADCHDLLGVDQEAFTATTETAMHPPVTTAASTALVAILRITMTLARFSKQGRGLTRGRRLIEQTCFERYAMQRLDAAGTQYELAIPFTSRELLDEEIYALLDEMFRISDDNQCMLEASFHEAATDTYWD